MLNSGDFVKRLKEVCAYYNLTASNFADAIEVQRSSLSHIFSGRNKPSLDFVLKVVSKFPEVDMYWLLNGKGSFPKVNTENTTVRSNPPSTPSLFQEKNTSEQSSSVINAAKNSSNKTVTRVLIFYNDGTFEEFTK